MPAVGRVSESTPWLTLRAYAHHSGSRCVSAIVGHSLARLVMAASTCSFVT